VTLHLVLPGDVDDAARPSGGNVYGARIRAGLPAAGLPVRAHAVDGPWPRPDAPALAALDTVLSGVPDGGGVLLDGLVACGAPAAVLPHARRLRLAVLVHQPLEHDAETRVLRAAATVVATSRWTARRLRAVHGVRAAVVAPGVDPAPPQPGAAAGTRLLCLGSVTRTKGQDLLVEALARIADRTWTARLAGSLDRDRAQVGAVRELLARHGLDRRVTLPGPLTGAALDAAWAGTDLLVLPSRAETYGMVLTEALARGIPVVATAVGGVPATLGEPVPGLLAGPDPDALAAAITRWLDEPALRADARAAAADRRPALTGWEVTCRCLAQVLPNPA
jgi:glycosyltransferase involved in cell wall biosynthesis